MRPVLLVLLILAARLQPAAAGSANFLDHRDYFLRGTPQAAVAADVNNDGIPDAVVATFAGTAVLLGRGDGTFRAPVNVGIVGELSVAVADFNGDGKPDIAASVILTTGAQITLALGNGNGTFQKPRVLPIPCTDCYLAAADCNGDGKMDLAVASASSVTVFLGNGDGTFRSGQPAYPTSFASSIATGDVNNDGHPDLVVSDFSAGTLVVLLGNGDGSFARSDYPNGSQPYQAVLADFNGDGLPDLAAPDRAANTVLVRLNQGGGIFGPSASFPAACSPFGPQTCTLEGLAAGDVNHDGHIDLATPGGILLGNGDGTFQSAIPFYSGSVPLTVASADFNRDGYADLLVCNSGATNIAVLLGNRHPSKQPILAAGNRPKAVATGDFNGDGKADLAVAASGENAVHVFLGKGDGTFTPAPDLSAQQPGAVLALDLNGDGKTDLAVSGDYGTWIYLGKGDGTFTAGTKYASLTGDCTPNAFSSTAAPCFVAADFNGDGIPDLAAALWINGTISFLLGNGDGTFRAGPPPLAINDTPQGLAAGDFNHDGRLDIAVSGLSGSVHVFPGKGDGTFGSAATFSVGSTAAGLAAGDVNGDGNLDLVVAGGSSASTISLGVFVVTGNGDLTFNPPVALVADEAPNGVVLGDFNGDGLIDIASANLLADDVSVHINLGNLSFAPALLYGAGGGPVVLAAADLNGDQRLDILAVNQYSGDLSVLLHAPR